VSVEAGEARTARRVNETVREVAASLDRACDATFDFVCERGCLAFAPMTIPAYDQAGGAWAQDHRDDHAHSKGFFAEECADELSARPPGYHTG
jgi:hypothetical protein